MKAAVYCRVSTEDQEREGTSLQSQQEACLAKVQELGYEVPEEFVVIETYSGLSLERPKLNELREWVRNKKVDAIVAYTLDRLSRDPVHFIILQEEFERASVQLIMVTETIDSSDMGKLITHIKGFAAKLEAEKIKERTMRGKRTRIEKYGKLPTGRGVLYGYSYDKESGLNIANSCLDNVRMVGTWLLEEGIPLNEACRRLMEKGIPAPKGGEYWSRGSLGRIMRNTTYAGKTYAFKTATKDNKRVICSQENQVEIPNAVDRTAFTWNEWLTIQRQLDKNRELSPRNQKLSYLLRGRVFCKQDGRKYYGVPVHGKPYYRCSGRIKLLSNTQCTNKTMNAKVLEEAVWSEVARVLRNPELVLAELERRKNEPDLSDLIENDIADVITRLKKLDKEQERLLQWALKGFPEETVTKENEKINKEKAGLQDRKVELEKRFRETKENQISLEGAEKLCELARENLANFTYTNKQLALEALNIKVWIEGDSVTVEGILPVPEVNIVSQPLSLPVSRLKYQPRHQPDDLQGLPRRQFLPWLT